MFLLSVMLLVLWGERCRCVFEDAGSATFDGDVRVYAVATNTVYVATNERLYQLNHDLTLNQSLTLKGILKNRKPQQGVILFTRVPEATFANGTFRINVLLPVEGANSVISCGATNNKCGHCEILDQSNISILRYNETIQVGPLEWDRCSSAVAPTSVAILVKVTRTAGKTDTYILTAIGQNESCTSSCASDAKTINLQNTDYSKPDEIFSFSGDHETNFVVHKGGEVEFVDGFQVHSTIYVLSNLDNNVRLLWLEGRISKSHVMRSLRGATLVVDGSAGQTHRLVASSVVPGADQVLWGGVFGSRGNTELVLFDITPDMSIIPDKDPDFCSQCTAHNPSVPKILRPRAVLLRKNNMTSVLAVRNKAWMVFFIGMEDGQLIKLAVDKHLRISCAIVLYRARDDRRVFHQLLMDQVDHRHIYVPLGNEMRRVPVSRCSTYTDVHDCWSAQDPHCVWCGSKTSCTFEDDCSDSDWVSIPDDLQQRMVSYGTAREEATGQITLNIQTHVTAGPRAMSNFTCEFAAESNSPCDQGGPPPHFPECICTLRNITLPSKGLKITVRIRLGTIMLLEPVVLNNCSDITGPPSVVLCQRCIRAGCDWSKNKCSWANQGSTNESVCQTVPGKNFSEPQISSITPHVVSLYGKNNALLSGRDLGDVIRLRIQTNTACRPQELYIWNNTGVNLTFHIPRTDITGVASVCAVLPDGSCRGNFEVTYKSLPSCTDIEPSSTWLSGRRNVTLKGSKLDLVDGITQSNGTQEARIQTNRSHLRITYETLAAGNSQSTFTTTVFLKVANETVLCSKKLTYYPDPTFTSFKPSRWGSSMYITIEKKPDSLSMTTGDLSAWGVHKEKLFPCIMKDKDNKNGNELFICEIIETNKVEFRQLLIKFGDRSVTLHLNSSLQFLWLLLVLVPILCFTVVLLLIYRRKQQMLTDRMNRLMENLELDIRNDIRQGFVDLQTETAELMENVGAIPFLDYKHFACRIFFPEGEALLTLCITDISQDTVKVQLDECCRALSQLIHDQLFLRSMVHALEEQKSFNVKDKCVLASLLTVTLHSDLLYLTEVMEVLLRDLMLQNNNTQPKLLLRRTESIVEKLLTNWMSICLYGFLRESVGQHLFLLVSALTQHINKGPVDCVTQKSLYTLSEDWLLWQAQDFSSLKLKVLFAVGIGGEVSEPLEVNCLTCDTVDQVKEKILSTFRAKFGFPYNMPLKDIHIEYENDGSFVPLEEVDRRSEVMGDVTMLNTMKHYQVPDGATVKVLSNKTHPPLSPQGSVKDDENFTGKYFHLIDPDVVEDQQQDLERKKLKVKEVHLTKLLSTKVAVHSYMENLFRSIWGTQQGKAPHAIKYFFDFLDKTANEMKISDPDVLHIWRTNSLPLRFWVNILKNPQFVFDMEKSPQLDGCLSVIAQAFMDSFSLSETQLDKNTPTNKLLYAKDIPKFKQEVKEYYNQVRRQQPITDSGFKAFLQEESKKHQNEFNEPAALREIFKFIQRYFTQIQVKLNQNGAPTELMEQLTHVRDLFYGLKSCSWS